MEDQPVEDCEWRAVWKSMENGIRSEENCRALYRSVEKTGRSVF